MEDFIDDFMAKPDKKQEVVENDISVENVDNVEATPFIPDGTELITIIPDPNPAISTDEMLPDQMKDTIEHHLQRSSSVYALNYQIENNKILIQDLKSSIVSLKVSTSRIERDVKELSTTVGKYNNDKTQLTTSLVDLEFRFNELVTKQEETDGSLSFRDFETAGIDANIKEIVAQIEGKIQKLDAKLAFIDEQNQKITALSQNIQQNEKMVKEIQGTLSFHAKELIKLEDFQKLPGHQNVSKEEKPALISAGQNDSNALEKLVNQFIAKTELNEKQIATAWVGLIAALFLIPIAYIMGKFF